MQSTTTLTNTQVVKECYRLFNDGNIEELLNQFTDNVQWIDPAPKDLVPYGGKRDGKPAVREYIKLLEETVDVQTMEPREFIEQENRVIVLGHWEAKVRKTGKILKSEWAMAFTLKNGKVARCQEYSDTHSTVEAFRTATGRSSGN